jgi:TolA-binding protein
MFAAEQHAALGEYAEAFAAYQEIETELAGTGAVQMVREAVAKLRENPDAAAVIREGSRAAEAQEALAAARTMAEAGNHVAARARYNLILRRYANTPAAAAAQEALDAYANQATDTPTPNGPSDEVKAERIFKLAESYRKAGRDGLAEKKYQEVIEKYPDTYWARRAATFLK